MRTLNYGDTLIGQTLSLDFSSLKYDGNVKPAIIAKSKNGSMIRCNTESNTNFITIQDGSNSTILYKRISDSKTAEVSLTEYACNSFDDIVYLNTDIFGYSCIKVDESANHKPLRINIDDINTYSGKYITATTCEGTSPIRRLNGYTRQEIREESKSTVTGTEVTVNDTYVNNQTEFTIDGNSYQETTEGYNLYNIDEALNDVLKKNGDSSYTFTRTSSRFAKAVNISIPANTDFVIDYSNVKLNGNYEGKILSAVIKYTDDTDTTSNLYSTDRDSRGLRRYSKDIKSIQLYLESSVTEGTSITFSDFMIYLGSSLSKAYEPYTGGIPSPNLDYQQKITSVGGYDNIFDKNNIISGSYVSDGKGSFVSDSTSKRTDYIEIQANSYYYIYSDKATGNWGAWYDKDKKFISGITLGGKNEGTVNSPANAKYIVFTISYQGNLADYSNIKINETVLRIKQSGKNSFNNSKALLMSSLSYSNGIYSASDNDTNTMFGYKIQQYDSNRKFIPLAGEIKQNIDKPGIYYFTAKKYTTAKYLRIGNIGKTKEFQLYYPLDDINVGDYYTVVINVIDTTIGASKFKDVMLLKGKITSASYEPYHEPIITPINLQGNILSKVGDVKDILRVNRKGEVEIKKNIGKVTFVGDDTYVWNTSTSSITGLKSFWISINTYKHLNWKKVAQTKLSNYFKYYKEEWKRVTKPCICENTDLTPDMCIFSGFDSKMSLADWKTRLSQHPTEVYYELATPQIITLPSITPIELWQGTNIFSLVTNLDTEIELEYNYIPQSPSPEAPSEIRNMGDNINIFNKNSTFINYQSKVEVLDTGIKVTNLNTTKYASAYTSLGSDKLLGKTITLYSDIEESEGATANVLLYFGTGIKPTLGGVIQKINNNSKNSGLWKIPSSFPEGCDRIHLYFYSSDSTEPTTNSYVKYNNLKVEVRDTPSPYSEYGCGSTRITSSTENLANAEQLYNEMVSFNSRNVRKEIVDGKNCIVFTNSSYRAMYGFRGLRGKYKKNTQYVIRLKARGYDTSISGSSDLFVQARNKNGDLIGSDSHTVHGATWIQFSFLTNTDSSLDYIDFSYGNQTDWCVDLDSFEIYESTSVKAVDKNKDANIVVQFNEGQRLMEGDYLVEDKIHRKRKRVEFDGSESWTSDQMGGNTGTTICFKVEIDDYIGYDGGFAPKGNLTCTHFKEQSIYQNELEGIQGGWGKYIFLKLKRSNLITADEYGFKTWLTAQKDAGTPVTVEYELAEEIIEPHKDALPLWIDQYKNQTNVYTSDESEVEVEMTSNESLAKLLTEVKDLSNQTKILKNDTPIGTIVEWGSYAAPEGWLLCNGQAVSRTSYSELFDVIGTFFGSGDGSTTFNLPNRQGRFGYGATSSDSSSNYSLGKTGGEFSHTLTASEMPSHRHEGLRWGTTEVISLNSGDHSGYNLSYTGGNSGLPNSITTALTGGGQPHNNMPPYLVINYIIKAKQTTAQLKSTDSKILNNTTESTDDAYSCDYINQRLFGIVLFENSAGDNTGSIILNDSITKYPEVKIDYVIAVGDYITHESKRVSITSGHVIELSSVIAHSATIQLVHTGRYLFKDKAVTRVVETRSRITSAANVGWDGTSSGIYITKITGFIQ